MAAARTLVVTVTLAALTAVPSHRAVAPPSGPRPVVFVHGLGGSSADVGVSAGPEAPPAFGDLLTAIARRYPLPDVCQDDVQGGRPWTGSPCVFRYVEDMAEAAEGGAAARGPNDSQSGVAENADKLAGEVEQVVSRAGGRRAVLIGYSMGGAIIRTYLSLHADRAARDVAVVVIIDGVTQGSWGYSLIGSVAGRAEGPLRGRVLDLLRTAALTASAVNLDRPAANDLRPRSELYRRITAVTPPTTISYYTFWGDIRIEIGRRLLVYDLPDVPLPSLGDLGLLPGDPNPAALPELGGQRFSPTSLQEGYESLDIPHTTRLRIDAVLLGRLLDECGTPSPNAAAACRLRFSQSFAVINTHTQLPFVLGRVLVESPELGGRVSILDAVLTAVARNETKP